MSREDKGNGSSVNDKTLQFTASLLCELPSTTTQNSQLESIHSSIQDQKAPWIAVHGSKCAVIVGDRTQVQLVDVLDLDGAKNAAQITIETHEKVQAMAFSICGKFLALADATGTLSLYKSNGTLLFGHQVVRGGSDCVVSIKFATSQGLSGAQEVVVVTKHGILLLLGNLKLAEFEELLLEKPKEALSEILRIIRFDRTSVGRLKENAQSCMLVQRCQAENFVFLGNHEAFLSVWKTRDNEKQSGIEQVAVNDSRSALVEAMDFDANYNALVILCEGKLSWWNWRDMTELFEADIFRIMSFAVIRSCGENGAESTLLLAVGSSDDGTSMSTFQLVRIRRTESGAANAKVVSRLEWIDCLKSNIVHNVVLFATTSDISRCQVLAACQTNRGVTMVLLREDVENSTSEADESVESEDRETVFEEDAVTIAESLVDTPMSSLMQKGVIQQYQGKLKVCTSSIGDNEDETRVILKDLVHVASNIREYTSSSPRSSLRMASLLRWCDEISELSYQWTTFQLLRSSSTAETKGNTLREQWHQFRAISVVELLEKYLKLGSMRAVRIMWGRHVDDASVRNIGTLLENLPASLPVSVYASWLQNEVIPVLIHHADQTQSLEADTTTETGTRPLLDQVALWVLKRAEDTAANSDLDTAIRICNVLKPESGENGAMLSFYEFRRHTSRSAQEESNVFERIERLSEKLRHVQRLAAEHHFVISLSVFEDETPATIAMSMLDRVLDTASLKTAIEDHVRKYLEFCSVEIDPVLHDYVKELAESIQTPQSAEETRALVLLDEISDTNVRIDATLALLRSTLPPYSDALKKHAHNCTQWKSERQDELEEHVRLMEIQDMLTKYGIKQFDIADTKSASRLVSHILNQVSIPSAFVDAMLLVDAYSDLCCDRAVVGYTENLLTECDTMTTDGLLNEVSARVTKAMEAFEEVKKRRDPKSNVMLYASIMEEIVEFGVTLLELEAEEMNGEDDAKSQSFILCMIKSLVDVYLHELKTLLELAGTTRDDSIIAYVESSDYLLSDTLLTDLQRICQVEAEFGLLLSISTLRDPDKCEAKLKQLIKPDILFAEDDNEQEPAVSVTYVAKGKGKKRALASNESSSSVAEKRQRTSHNIESHGLQQDDKRTRLIFDINRFASAVGIDAKACRSLIAQSAANSGSILQAVRFSRELFSKRANAEVDRSEHEFRPAEALKKTAISLSLYTSSHVKEIYDTPFTRSQQYLPAQVARVQAPMYTLELLRYALCMCEKDSFDETLILFKNTLLVNEILQFTQHNVSNTTAPWTLYPRWYRGDACALSSYEAMKLVTRFAIAEHKNLRREVEFRDTIASKRYVSFLVEQRADLLSLQALMSMQELPEDAAIVVNTQMGKLLSTVFQSQEIDNYLALGLMLSMKQEDAFHAFRRQISRENVAKDFNRFQKLAFIGADAARAWQQIAFLHQCVELEGNARWWHYLNLLGIECDHKAFQTERRDLQYIRRLVPQLITRSNYDFYTILEFTRHYQIEDSFPSLVYAEALLLDESSTNLEYQDKIVGVIDEIHEQHLVKLLLKSIPRISGRDYDRLLFIFRLLLENTVYREREEVERRVDVLRHLKAFVASQSKENSDKKVSFHELITKPREVLSRLVTKENFNAVVGLVEPLRLEPDELQMLLLKNMITNFKLKTVDGETSVKFSAFEDILVCLSDTESRVTAAEWLAENFPLGGEKLKALEFALKAAVFGQTDSEDPSSTSFIGHEAQARLETKILRVKVEMLFRNATSQVSSVADVINDKELTNQLLTLVTEPKKLFKELYRRYALVFYNHNSDMLHAVASSIGDLLELPQEKIRLDLVCEWLVKDAVHIGKEDSSEDTKEDPFELITEEKLHQADENFGKKILYLTSASVKAGDLFGHQVLSYLIDFAKDPRPRAGVTYRAKMRALRVILRLGQLYHAAVERFVTTKYGSDNTDLFFKELLEHSKHYNHLMTFEEHRVPYDMSHLLESDKEALTRSFLRRCPPKQRWVLRCASQLMLDFDVAATDLWEDVLTNMLQLGMVRSLAAIMGSLSRKPFVRSLSCGQQVWEKVLTSPMIHLKRKHNQLKRYKTAQDRRETKDSDDSLRFAGIHVSSVRSVMQRTVVLLQRCPFLDQIDVPALVVHLRDLNAVAEEEPDGAGIVRHLDLYGFAVKCAMVIPNPRARFEALMRIIHAGAYSSVLYELLDASCFFDENIGGENGEFADNCRLMQESFSEAARRKDYASILGTPLEPGFVEYLAATGDIDYLLSLLLEDKRMDTALTAVELYFEFHPAAAPSLEDTQSSEEKTDASSKRWELIDAYLAVSKSIHLERFRAL
ncbi:hypothetical protein L915_19926 [Phytophthora nicotianae]|uniref:Uncharacterized protein n=1 Tax=Phytophthora nicotianae TaxID=4792 RepID=W2FR06_PHYNI|nr:hypothetical protein L915_19926 [Phytophthora nicotianae]